MDLTLIDEALTGVGFQADAELKTAHEEAAVSMGMDTGGPYKVLAVYRKGLTNVLIEQNTASEQVDGMEITTSHPALALVQGPKGKVGCNPSDIELLLSLITELS